ncbi:MAG: TetR family transcriptional regulator [Chromatiales bacterium]|nr:MAG: TetR family transcriptional regulator [Chromatiales bacterium]
MLTKGKAEGRQVVSRAEKKARTRSALMDSVLAIIGYGANFASISLREVAKTAGLVPTSFYRHFGDMEELGLAMVDELGLNLRRLMRGTFDAEQDLDELIQHAIVAYHSYVLDNANLFRFMNQARTGGTPGLQDAIRNEVNSVIGRVATELSQLLPSLKSADREVVAGLIVSTLLDDTTSLLAIPKGQEALRNELTERTMQQMALIVRGAEHWSSQAHNEKAS